MAGKSGLSGTLQVWTAGRLFMKMKITTKTIKKNLNTIIVLTKQLELSLCKKFEAPIQVTEKAVLGFFCFVFESNTL